MEVLRLVSLPIGPQQVLALSRETTLLFATCLKGVVEGLFPEEAGSSRTRSSGRRATSRGR